MDACAFCQAVLPAPKEVELQDVLADEDRESVEMVFMRGRRAHRGL